MDYDKMYADVPKPKDKPVGGGMMQATAELAALPAMVLPDTNDLKTLAASGVPLLMKKAMLLAYQSDNLTQVLAVAKEINDRAYGKAEQSVSAKVEMIPQERSLQEIAHMMLFAMRDAKERGLLITDKSAI